MNRKKQSKSLNFSNLVKAAHTLSQTTRDELLLICLTASADSEVTTEERLLMDSLKGEFAIAQPYPSHMPPCIGYDKGLTLLDFLVEKGFIEISSEPVSFLYRMGCTCEIPNNLTLIKWKKSKQLLKEMLDLLFEKKIMNGATTKGEIKRLVPLCFLDKNGNEMVLAKNKDFLCEESEALKKFFATFFD